MQPSDVILIKFIHFTIGVFRLIGTTLNINRFEIHFISALLTLFLQVIVPGKIRRYAYHQPQYH